jgi:cytochrome oxidase Cu insertion factor (SCO1/SenC/PrrC family)
VFVDFAARKPVHMPRALNDSRIILGLCLLVLAPTVGFAARQQPGTPTTVFDVESVGPKVGEALPLFSLQDQSSRTRSLKSLLGPEGAVIVFFRSADW